MSLLKHGSCSQWRYWASSLLVCLFVIVPSGVLTANEVPNWQNEIENMQKKLLYSLDCFNQISTLATEQSSSHEEALRLLDEQERLLDNSQTRIDYLSSQIAISQQSSEASLTELAALQTLQKQAQQQFEKVSAAYAAYKQEATGQIKEIQRERDRARLFSRLGLITIGILVVGGTIGFIVVGG